MKKSVNKFKRIGLLGNADKPAFRSVIRKAARLIQQSGRTVHSDGLTLRFADLKCHSCPDAASLAREVDLLLVFGGDGTMLQVAREIASSPTPIFGVNIGGLGFLTGTSAPDLDAALKKLWLGQVRFESRSLIEAQRQVSGRTIRHRALNDFVLSHGSEPRLVDLAVSVNGQLLTRYRADGLIVSTPTGSTAYALAAGGAVISPTVEALELTPICAHTISNRPLILDMASVIQIKVVSARPTTVLSGDGQVLAELTINDEVTICRSRHTVRLVQLARTTFLDTLRAKLHWRGATV